MKWIWNNTTQVVFGPNVVTEHMKDYVQPKSRILCTFGGGSIERNGTRKEVQDALDALHCEVRWEGGIPPNPEYDRLVEILKVAREFQPDLLLAVGGGSTIDGTKFLSCAIHLPEDVDPWKIITDQTQPPKYVPLATVLTIPATGSEWNSGFVISRRSMKAKLSGLIFPTFPKFSLLDARYTMTLPLRQLRNGVFDAICHCMDQYITPQDNPLQDKLFMSVFKELVEVGPEIIKENSSIELHERLVMAASFALNYMLALGIETDWSIHMIGQQLTALYGIDHGATLSICSIPFFEEQFENRKAKYAQTAEYVFGVREGTVDEKARAFLTELEKFIKVMGLPMKVSEVEGVEFQQGDVPKCTYMVLESVGNAPFGFRGMTTKDITQKVLSKVIQ